MKQYTTSKDSKSGLWYAHQKGYSYIPIAGSFSEKKIRRYGVCKNV